MSHHNPRALLTPQMRSVLDRIERANRLPMYMLTPEQAKAFYEAGACILDLAPHKLKRVEELGVPTRDGEQVAARLYAPALPDAEPGLPVLLYLHGGGFTVGSLNTHDSLCRHLSHLAHCAVLSLDYRLAPQHKFPTAVNDAWDALLWLREHAAGLGLDPQRIAIGGDSAGGTLSLATAIQARDAGIPLALQLLFYPGCTPRRDTPSQKVFGKGFLIERATIDWFFSNYLNHDEECEDWRFAPLMAHDFDGLAPAWFGLAECDPLVDEGILMADRLRLSGVPVDLEIYRGVVHDFIKMGRSIPEALIAHQDAARALRQAFSRV
jgi:acetyl esterase